MTFTHWLGLAGVVLAALGVYGLLFALESRFKSEAGESSHRYLFAFVRDYIKWRRRK